MKILHGVNTLDLIPGDCIAHDGSIYQVESVDPTPSSSYAAITLRDGNFTWEITAPIGDDTWTLVRAN